MSDYVYCFARTDELRLDGLTGLGGSVVRRLAHGNFSAVISELAPDFQPNPDRSSALAHNSVVNAVLAESTPVPCRFGNVIERAQLLDFMESNAPLLLGLLERFSGHLEMDIRVVLAMEGTPEGDTGQADKVANHGNEAIGAGTRFLREKQIRKAAEDLRRKRLEEAIDRIDARFLDRISDKALLTNAHGIVAGTAHLIRRDDLKEHRSMFEQTSSSFADDVKISLSGPWAPYSFVPGLRLPAAKAKSTDQSGRPSGVTVGAK